MSYLEKFARNKRGNEQTRVLTARLPISIYDEFQQHCSQLGLSLSEGIGLLVQNELESSGYAPNSDFEQPNEEENTNTSEDEYKAPTLKKMTNTNGGRRYTSKTPMAPRGIAKKFEYNGQIPCPVCNSWISKQNGSRHFKGHDMTTEQVYSQYEEKALQMLKNAKKQP